MKIVAFMSDISLKCVIELIEVTIVSDNGLAPNRRQAIVWTNDDHLLAHIITTPSHWVQYPEQEVDERSLVLQRYFDIACFPVHGDTII